MDRFFPHLILTSTVAKRLTAKVHETVEKKFVTEIKMLNRVTSSSARDCNYCSLCLQMYGVGADSCYFYPIIKCSKWGKGRLPSYIRLFRYVSRSKYTKRKKCADSINFLRIFNNVGLGGDLQPSPIYCTSLCSYCECFISDFIISQFLAKMFVFLKNQLLFAYKITLVCLQRCFVWMYIVKRKVVILD